VLRKWYTVYIYIYVYIYIAIHAAEMVCSVCQSHGHPMRTWDTPVLQSLVMSVITSAGPACVRVHKQQIRSSPQLLSSLASHTFCSDIEPLHDASNNAIIIAYNKGKQGRFKHACC